MNLNTQNQDNNLKSIGNNNLQNTKVTTKKNVYEILEKSEFDNDFKEFLRKTVSVQISKFAKENEVTFLQKYKTNSQEKNGLSLQEKIDKYYEIHANFLLKILKEQLDKKLENKRLTEKNLKVNLTENEYQNHIKNFISKYLYIIFIFSEKVDYSILENYLNQDISKLSGFYTLAFGRIKALEKVDNEIIEKIKNSLEKEENVKENNKEKQKKEEEKKEFKDFLEEPILAKLYRQTFREIILESDSIDSKTIALKIEEILKQTFSEFKNVLKTWKENGYYDNDYFDEKGKKILQKIEILLKKITESIIALKKQNIAFEEFEISNSANPNFIPKLLKYFEEDDIYLSEFLKIIYSKNKKQELKNFIEKLNQEEQETIKEMEPKIDENLEAKDTDLETWSKVSEDKKYKHLFEDSVFGKNGYLDIDENLFPDTKEEKELFYDYIAFKTKNNNIKNIIEEQLEKIFILNKEIKEEKEKIKLYDFIEKDVNDLNLLYYLFLFDKSIKTLKKKNLEINIENLKNLKYEPYGITEKIFKRIDSEYVNDKIFLIPEGRVTNTSVKNLDLMLKNITLGLKKGYINLENEKIKLEDENQEKITKIIFSYLENKKIKNYEKLKENTNIFIDSLQNILSLKYIDNEIPSFLKDKKIDENILTFLKDQKIITDENNIETKQYDKIQMLLVVLKYVLRRVELLQKMQENSQKDKKIILDILKEFGDNQNLVFITNKKDYKDPTEEGIHIGSDKNFYRAFEKLINTYGGDLNRLGDLSRFRIISLSLNESVNDIKNFINFCAANDKITHISIIDNTKEPIALPKKSSGYRDLKLLLKLTSGGVIEGQFLCKELVQVKEKGIELKNINIKQKLLDEGVLFKYEEMKTLLNIIKETKKSGIISLENVNILSKNNFPEKEYKEIFSEIPEENIKKELSTTDTYNIIRQLDLIGNENLEDIKKKLTRIERILSDYAWGKILSNYLQEKNINIGKEQDLFSNK